MTVLRRLWPLSLKSRFWAWAVSIALCALAAIVLSAVALRVEAMSFANRVATVTTGLSELRIGISSKPDAAALIPGLKPHMSAGDESFRCTADECLSVTIPTPRLSLWLLTRITTTGNPTPNEPLYSALNTLGVRFHDFEANLDVTSGKVSHVGYRLMLSTPDPAYPGALIVGVSSVSGFHDRREGALADESPDYLVSSARQFPEQRLGITFTSAAPHALTNHAFALRLSCLASWSGCRAVRQLLPHAGEDEARIQQAAIQRMRGETPCPDRILPAERGMRKTF